MPKIIVCFAFFAGLLTSCYGAAQKALDLPAYTHVEGELKTERVAMRDGVRLKTEVFFPEGKGSWPVILIRNPYNFPGGFGFLARLFTRYGYVGVHQLARGRAESEGEWNPFMSERDDGLDTLDWLKAQPWQNGNIGLFGASYLSMVQWAMADAMPPEVKTMVPLVWGSDLRSVAYQGGMFRYEVVTTWAALMHDTSMDNWNMGNFKKALTYRPHSDVGQVVFGAKLPWYEEWIQSPSGAAPIWRLPQTKLLAEIPPRVKIPVLSVGGWYDIFTPSQIDDYMRLGSRNESRLIMGPWTHLVGSAGDGDLPLPDSRGGAALLKRVLNWYGHYLKGEKLDEWGPIETYAINEGKWSASKQWPPEGRRDRLYFHGAAQSRSCAGGDLLNEQPGAAESITFVYDPEHPAPTRGGGGLLAFAIPGWGGSLPSMRDQAGLCERTDVLTWVSPPINKPVRIAGKMRVVFTVATTADDTAFTAKVIDVDAHGKAYNIQDAITSLAYRNGATMPTGYVPNLPVELTLDLSPIEWTVLPGHRLRVDVSSSNFPAYHAHSNYAGPWASQVRTRKARQSVSFSPEQPAYLELPTHTP